MLLDESPVNVIKVIKRVFYKMKWEYISFPTSAGEIKFILPGCWSVKYHESTKEIAQNYRNQCSQLKAKGMVELCKSIKMEPTHKTIYAIFDVIRSLKDNLAVVGS